LGKASRYDRKRQDQASRIDLEVPTPGIEVEAEAEVTQVGDTKNSTADLTVDATMTLKRSLMRRRPSYQMYSVNFLT
jgi:hypothetical protein